MPAVYSAFDVACSSSAWGEGFSNVLGEAMACGVPCVATGVGDSALIVGDTGRVIPPGRPEELAAACAELLSQPAAQRKQLGAAARDRVVREFSLRQMVEETEALLRELCRP
jgi:glycosyltransferase involved in cell wall biosynthesis